MSVVRVEFRDDLAIATVDNPPVNALSQAVRAGLLDAVDRAERAGSKAVVLHCAGRTFIAGADIREFGKPAKDPWLPEVIDRIEAFERPVVAAIHGTALGGGLELALGCHYRIAVPSARVGFPEVLLGLIPGAGGTQRLPRLVGAEHALDMMISGKPVNARDGGAAGHCRPDRREWGVAGRGHRIRTGTGFTRATATAHRESRRGTGGRGVLQRVPQANRAQDARSHVAGEDRAMRAGIAGDTH